MWKEYQASGLGGSYRNPSPALRLSCTSLYLSVPLCTSLYLSIPLCTSLYLYMPLCTSWLNPVPCMCTWFHLPRSFSTSDLVSLCIKHLSSNSLTKVFKLYIWMCKFWSPYMQINNVCCLLITTCAPIFANMRSLLKNVLLIWFLHKFSFPHLRFVQP